MDESVIPPDYFSDMLARIAKNIAQGGRETTVEGMRQSNQRFEAYVRALNAALDSAPSYLCSVECDFDDASLCPKHKRLSFPLYINRAGRRICKLRVVYQEEMLTVLDDRDAKVLCWRHGDHLEDKHFKDLVVEITSPQAA